MSSAVADSVMHADDVSVEDESKDAGAAVEEDEQTHDSFWPPVDDGAEAGADDAAPAAAESADDAYASAGDSVMDVAGSVDEYAAEEEFSADPDEQPVAGDLTSAFFAEMSAAQEDQQRARKRKKYGAEGEDEEGGGGAADSDDDYGVAQRRAFHVPAHLAARFDPASTEPPSCAEEYILRVRREADACPNVKVSSIDPRSFESRQTPYLPPLDPAVRPTNLACMPGPGWANAFARGFSEARQALLCFAAQNSHLRRVQVDGTPDARDTVAWISYCLGRHAREHHAPKVEAIDPASPSQTPAAAAAASSSTTPATLPHCPSLPLLVSMDQVSCKGILMQLLSHGSDEIERRQKKIAKAAAAAAASAAEASSAAPSSVVAAPPFPSHAYTLWIYSLLMKVDLPINAKLAADLRRLYRRLTWMRAHDNDPASQVVRNCNMLLTIFDQQFGQRVDM